MATQDQWTNTPNLEWCNTPDEEWNSTLILFVFNAIATFICKSKAYYFESENKARNFISKTKNYFFESKIRP